jgi:excisionase family DNA binding protein
MKGGYKMNFVDKKELAKYFNISVVTVDRLRKKGLPFHKLGAKIVFDKEEVTNWIKNK